MRFALPGARRLAILTTATACLPAAAAEIDFSRDVQPILAENCYYCHGPDQNHREAELRLDTRDGAFRVKDGAAVIVPEKPEASELVARIVNPDPDDIMPPPKSKKSLTPAQIDTLRQWIAQGARWGAHWSFAPLTQPAVPAAEGSGGNPIDAFLLAKLRREGLSPSPEAPKTALIRRAALVLTGLPPSPAEVDAFLADNQPGAYEKLVDRLMQSPHYGERMVWDWLDAARYADTNGFQGDPTRTMHFWRDWALKAFNDNMPFDRFTVEQLAGDLLPSPTDDQLVATGFHRNHMINNEGGRIPEESRVDYVQDRVETTATVWMGLTFNCCRCHNHKFDPFTQKDYYRLAAYFNSVAESGNADAFPQANPIHRFAAPGDLQALEEAKNREKDANDRRAAREKHVRESILPWAKEWAARPGPQWVILAPDASSSENGATLTKQPDNSLLASGASPAKDAFVIKAKAPVKEISALRLETLPDSSLKNSGPGRAPENGNFVLSEISLTIAGKPAKLANGWADFEQGGFPARNSVDGNPGTGWAVMPEFGKAHSAIWSVSPVVPSGDAAELTIRLEFQTQHVQHVLGKFRLSVTSAPADALPVAQTPEIAAILTKPSEALSPADKKKLEDFRLATDGEIAALKSQADEAKRRREELEKAMPTAMVMRDLPAPRPTHILIRGAYDNPGEKVEHGVPEGLPALPADAPKNRLALARWLVSPEHPLTARVTVNRFWQGVFGTGLVRTAEDFGIQGAKPTHPELLDWLAAEFVRTGWDVKRLMRLMVCSQAFRQSSKVSPAALERDPENFLLSRGPRRRLASWMLRDQALAVSGMLERKIGGPPVKPYQPDGVWEDATFGQIRYEQDHGEALYRRSLYTFWRRIVGPTMFFDVSSRQSCAVRQAQTNTPLHALVTLNETTFAEAARALGQRVLKEKEAGADDASRLRRMFVLCTARQPREDELRVLTDSLTRLRREFSASSAEAARLLAVGESKPAADIPPAELAAWASLGAIVLNLDEVVCLE